MALQNKTVTNLSSVGTRGNLPELIITVKLEIYSLLTSISIHKFARILQLVKFLITVYSYFLREVLYCNLSQNDCNIFVIFCI